jgi:hypothetical protein
VSYDIAEVFNQFHNQGIEENVDKPNVNVANHFLPELHHSNLKEQQAL